MRILIGIVGVLMVLVAGVGGLAGAVVISDAGTDSSWSCTSYADASTNTTKQDCYHRSDSDPAQSAQDRDLGLSLVVGSAALFVGGCVFVGAAVTAGGRTATPRPTYAPQPVPSAGPPTYGP